MLLPFDPLVNFFPMDADMGWGVDAEADLAAFNLDDLDPDVIANPDKLAYSPGKNQHWDLPW